jgi:hypothetical protein
MDISVQKMIVLAVVGCMLAGISAWVHINDRDGSGWALLAFCFLVTSCQQAQ